MEMGKTFKEYLDHIFQECDMNQFENKNIVITGATSGIGRSLTKKLNTLGANLAICGRSEIKMSQLLNDLNLKNGNFHHETFDISNENAIISFIKNTKKKLGQIDILVNCAGANTARGFVSEINTKDLEWMLKVNLVAPFIFMRETYKTMSNKDSGVFINVLSTVCDFSNEGLGAYTASKAGFDALVKVFRKEVREKNIKVCSIYPGGVDTPFREASRPDYLNPEKVADAIISMIQFDSISSVDELVIRPMIEKNYC